MRGGFGGRGGGGVRVGVAPRPAFANRGLPTGAFRVVRPIPMQRGFVHGAVSFNHSNHITICTGFGGRCFLPSPFFPGGFRHHHHHNQFFFGFGSPFFNSFSPWGWGGWPYYGYAPPLFSDYDNASYSVQTDAELAERQRLMNDLEEERRRTNELQDQMAELRSAPPIPAAPPVATHTERPSPPTTLIFRDKHQLEVQNYVIADGTLVELGQHWTRRIKLADLDIPATVKVNEENGVEFQLPTKAK